MLSCAILIVVVPKKRGCAENDFSFLLKQEIEKMALMAELNTVTSVTLSSRIRKTSYEPLKINFYDGVPYW